VRPCRAYCSWFRTKTAWLGDGRWSILPIWAFLL